MSVDLLCIYPHTHEVTGERVLPGDFRAVPYELVDQFLAPNHRLGQPLFARDPYAKAPTEEQLAKEAAAKLNASLSQVQQVEADLGAPVNKLAALLEEQAKEEAEKMAAFKADQEKYLQEEVGVQAEQEAAKAEALAKLEADNALIEAEVLAQIEAEKAEAQKAESKPSKK